MLNETDHEKLGDYHSPRNAIKSSTHIIEKVLKQFLTWIKEKGGYNEYSVSEKKSSDIIEYLIVSGALNDGRSNIF